jgi:hypothetical protein
MTTIKTIFRLTLDLLVWVFAAYAFLLGIAVLSLIYGAR